MFIFARHGETPSIALQEAGSPESRIQGVGKEMPLSRRGEIQSSALGYAVGDFVATNNLEIVTVQTPDVLRATQSREIILGTAALDPEPVVMAPDRRLRNMSKGDLEGMLRSEAYPTEGIREQQANDWHFRHGSIESGGETAYETGRRWLEWFMNDASLFDDDQGGAHLAVGCNFVTAFGTWMLTHPDESSPDSLPPLRDVTQSYRINNGTAVVVEGRGEEWEITDRIIPADEHLELAEFMADATPYAQLV